MKKTILNAQVLGARHKYFFNTLLLLKIFLVNETTTTGGKRNKKIHSKECKTIESFPRLFY